MATKKTIPPVPTKTRVVNDQGFLDQAWLKFFINLFDRVGGNIALDNVQLETQQIENLDEIEADILALENLTTVQTASIASNTSDINDILQGPNL